MLGIKGYSILKKNYENEIEDIINELTISPISIVDYGGESEEFCVCLENKKKLFVPKYYGLQKFGLPEINLPNEEYIDLEFNGKLMENQIEPVNEYLNNARDPLKMGGILQLPPGYGKTVMALYILCELNVKTLIIVHKEFLMTQWKDRIEQYIPGCEVGIIKQSKTDIDKPIVIGSLQSICSRNYDNEVFNGFGLVIIDECHHIGAQVFSRALNKVNFKYSLGLSATVNRKDGLSKVFKWFIGDIVYKIQKKKTITTEVLCLVYNEEEYQKEETMYNGKPNISKMINNICEYLPRTKYIVDTIKELYDNRNIIVLSDRRKHLEDMYGMLDGYERGYYVGGMKKEQLKESEEKKVILGTYNMVSEGFDLPKLDTLILASPKSDIEQSVGRIQRKHEITEQDNIPLVVDIIDDYSVFKNQAKKRKAFYKRMKFNDKK